MRVPPEVVAMLDRLVLVRGGQPIEDLNEKFIEVSAEVLGDEYLVAGHAIRWKKSTATFEEVEATLERLDQELARELWESAMAGALTRD